MSVDQALKGLFPIDEFKFFFQCTKCGTFHSFLELKHKTIIARRQPKLKVIETAERMCCRVCANQAFIITFEVL